MTKKPVNIIEELRELAEFKVDYQPLIIMGQDAMSITVSAEFGRRLKDVADRVEEIEKILIARWSGTLHDQTDSFLALLRGEDNDR